VYLPKNGPADVQFKSVENLILGHGDISSYRPFGNSQKFVFETKSLQFDIIFQNSAFIPKL
jgi:hypothetical protein